MPNGFVRVCWASLALTPTYGVVGVSLLPRTREREP